MLSPSSLLPPARRSTSRLSPSCPHSASELCRCAEMRTSRRGEIWQSEVPQPSRDEFYHGCPIPGRASLMRRLDKRSPQGLLLQDLGPHDPEPTDFGELCVCQGPCQGGPEQPAQAAGDWGSQVPPGSLSHAGAHGPFSPFNSQHQSPWGATLGDGGSLPQRHPTLGWQHLVVLNLSVPFI